MAENSKIAWTDHTFNPWIGCQKVSAACDNCYAESWDARFKGERWGPHSDRTRTADANWRKPLGWNRQMIQRVPGGSVSPRSRVFCASLADVFDNHKSIQPQWREDLWYMIRETPNLDWLLLTKRPQNIAKYLPEDWGDGYPNVWLGTTVENQEEAERRLPHLLQVPAVVHFVSCEPLLGPLDLTNIFPDMTARYNALTGRASHLLGMKKQTSGLDWVIAGGESGTNYRVADPFWFRSLRDQCIAADVPFLFKQHEGKTRKEIDAKGRELDGVVWDQFPEPHS